jgi:hypothetical protein
MQFSFHAKKAAFMGAGVGLVLFAIFGLLPGSMLGGVMGLNIAGFIFGTPLTPGIFSRLIVGASMLIGIMVAGIVFVFGFSLVGWLLGHAVDIVAFRKKAEEKVSIKS